MIQTALQFICIAMTAGVSVTALVWTLVVGHKVRKGEL